LFFLKNKSVSLLRDVRKALLLERTVSSYFSAAIQKASGFLNRVL